MVLDVDSKVVDALIEHGIQPAKGGTGAFAQYSDKRNGATGKVRLAISSFLLTRSNNDGYDKVLQKAWGLPTPEATHKKALEVAEPSKFSIIAAVKNQASKAIFSPPAGQAGDDDDTKKIIVQPKTYANTIYEQFVPEATTNANWENFRKWLGTDEPITRWPAIEQARNNVRAFLRRLPAVAACTPPLEGGVTGIDALTAAEKKLQALQGTLVGHDFVFRDRTNYAWMFDLAARGIRGWFPPYPG